MTQDLVNNITMTAIVLALMFLLLIQFSPDDPPMVIKSIGVGGLISSVIMAFVFTLINIWGG